MAQQPPVLMTDAAWNGGDPIIERFIEPHPHKPGAENARLVEYGFSVWILIDALEAADQDRARVAEEYEIPQEAIEAAQRFYHSHQAAIDGQNRDHALFHRAAVER